MNDLDRVFVPFLLATIWITILQDCIQNNFNSIIARILFIQTFWLKYSITLLLCFSSRFLSYLVACCCLPGPKALIKAIRLLNFGNFLSKSNKKWPQCLGLTRKEENISKSKTISVLKDSNVDLRNYFWNPSKNAHVVWNWISWCLGYLDFKIMFFCTNAYFSMTTLLTHTVAHSTRHSFRPKTNK